MAGFEEVFDKLVEKNAFNAIKKTMYEETKIACTALLGIYTESLGSLYSIHGEINTMGQFQYGRVTKSKPNFKRCLKYMGGNYCKIYDDMDTKKTNLYDVLRNGTTHEFDPKLSYKIIINPKQKPDVYGIEYVDSMFIKINLKEYFRDLKKSYQKWKKEVHDDKTTWTFAAVMRCSSYHFPPQGGIGKIIDRNGDEYVIKTDDGENIRK